MSSKIETLVDEGFRVMLVADAYFDGNFEIPHITRPENIVIPLGMVPFSLRSRSKNKEDFICFYEYDINFRDILTHTEDYVDELGQYPGVITPDCSLYIDAPLCVQIASIYLNRAVSHMLLGQRAFCGVDIKPIDSSKPSLACRWGSDRSLYFVKRKSLKSEKLFPVFGKGIPHNRKDHVSSGCTAV